MRSQNLKSVSAVSAVVPSISKNIPNSASRGRGGQFLEEGPCGCPRLSISSCGCVTVEDAYGRAHWGPFNGFSHCEGLACTQSLRTHKDPDAMPEELL